MDLGDKGGRVAVVHMDTEGFGALGNVAGYDPKLCLFSVLFASSFYYNLRGLIDMVRGTRPRSVWTCWRRTCSALHPPALRLTHV